VPANMITDFITGEKIPDVGAEANRQAIEQFLVNEKGFLKKDIEVNVNIELNIQNKIYKSNIDIVVCVDNKRFIAVKCAPGSLGSREREILSAARLLDKYQIPLSVVSDGKTATVMDTVSGKKTGQGLNAIPSKNDIKKMLKSTSFYPLPDKRKSREMLIFRSYDSMNINIIRDGCKSTK